MKNLFLILFIAFNALIVLFAWTNFQNSVTYTCMFNHENYTISLGVFSLALGLFANMAGFLYAIVLKSNVTELCKAYQKKNENISVKSEADSAKIEVLEAKIASLEAALDAALNK